MSDGIRSIEALPALEGFICGHACELAPEDPSFRDDLEQEMRLAVMEDDGVHTLSYWKQRASWRAMDYLRRESREASRRDADVKVEKCVGYDTEAAEKHLAIEDFVEKHLGRKLDVGND